MARIASRMGSQTDLLMNDASTRSIVVRRAAAASGFGEPDCASAEGAVRVVDMTGNGLYRRADAAPLRDGLARMER
jgi:hypothetical protein